MPWRLETRPHLSANFRGRVFNSIGTLRGYFQQKEAQVVLLELGADDFVRGREV
jgi:hypothetical protein